MNGSRLMHLLATIGCGLLMVCCSSLQAPVTVPAFDAGALTRAAKDGVELAVKAICGQDDYLDLFDEDLPKSGIVALWVQMRNAGSARVEPNVREWSLQIGARNYSALSLDELFRRYHRANRIRMVAAQTEGAAKQNMERVSFRGNVLGPAAICEGFVFFRIDPALARGWTRSASLRARNIRIGPRNRTSIEILLPHAGP
jgi:hypothetical protein